MTPRARTILTLVTGFVLFGALVSGLQRLPAFGTYLGPYGTILDVVAPVERKVPNIISAVNFDYRGLDTMGEEYILFAAVAGLTLVLRKDRNDTTADPLAATKGRPAFERTDAVRAYTIAGTALTIAFGSYVAFHPHLTPGGGFQGGAITAGFAALVFLGLGYRPFERFSKHEPAELAEALGAIGYVIVGIATLVITGAFLKNALPLGESGMLFSTGTIPLINACVVLEVIAGFIVMFAEFAGETRVEIESPPEAS